jgi:hypothetical protein
MLARVRIDIMPHPPPCATTAAADSALAPQHNLHPSNRHLSDDTVTTDQSNPGYRRLVADNPVEFPL